MVFILFLEADSIFLFFKKKKNNNNSGFGEVNKFLVHSEFLVLLVLKRVKSFLRVYDCYWA